MIKDNPCLNCSDSLFVGVSEHWGVTELPTLPDSAESSLNIDSAESSLNIDSAESSLKIKQSVHILMNKFGNLSDYGKPFPF